MNEENRTLSSVTLSVSQRRFLIFSGEHPTQTDLEANWSIPLRIGVNTTCHEDILLDGPVQRLTLPLSATNDLVKLNSGRHGMYRVCYSAEMLERLASAVKAGSWALAPADRLGLLSDAMALARSGQASMPSVLSLILNYINEKDY